MDNAYIGICDKQFTGTTKPHLKFRLAICLYIGVRCSEFYSDYLSKVYKYLEYNVVRTSIFMRSLLSYTNIHQSETHWCHDTHVVGWLVCCLTAHQHRKVNLCHLRGRETRSDG